MALLEQLEQIVGPTGLLTGDELSHRISGFWNEPVRAKALVRPTDVDQLAAVVRLCFDHDQSMVTGGGGTGLVGGTVTTEKDLLLSTERLCEVEEIDSVGRTMTVQAGCVLQTIQERAAAASLSFPLDLGARGSCTIGGNIATNAGGIAVIRHGMTRDLVLGLEAVLADGTVVSSLYPYVKNNTGYDLKQLFIGSEGTLGIVTRAILKLKPGVGERRCALIACADFGSVTKLLNRLLDETEGNLSAYEVMWGDYYDFVVASLEVSNPPLATGYPYYVLAEVEANEPSEDAAEAPVALARGLEEGWVLDAVIPTSETQRRQIWSLREDTASVRRLEPVIIYDVGLAISDMPAYLQALRASLEQTFGEPTLYVWGHLGDGNLHLAVSAGDPAGRDDDQVDELVFNALRPFGGSVSAEHGIGLKRRPYLGHTRSDEEIALMRTLKRALDPKNLLNPGKVLAEVF